MDTCICTAESLSCPPETITTLIFSYAPMPNKKFKKKRERDEGLRVDYVSFKLKRKW